MDNPTENGVRFHQVPIDQNIIVSVVIPDLFGRFPQPPLNHIVPVLASCAKPLFQNLPGGSQYKDGNCFGNPVFQLSRTLYVDVEYQVTAPPLGDLQDPPVGA